MKQTKLGILLEKADRFTKKNSPVILAGCAIAGVVATVYCAWKASPKAEEVLKKHREDMKTVKKGDKEAKRAVTVETVKEMTPIVAPTVIMAGATITAIIGSQKINSRRIAALSAAYTMSSDLVKDLNDQMQKEFGKKKADKVKDAVFEKKMKEENGGDIPKRDPGMVKKGLYWCRDYYTGNLFMTNANIINKAINAISTRVRSEMYITLGEFWNTLEDCGSIGMERLAISPLKDEFGWTVDDLVNGTLDISYTSVLDEDDMPILAIEYSLHHDFR